MTIVLISDVYSFDKGTAVIVREDFMETNTEFRVQCHQNKISTEIDKAGTYFVMMNCDVEERKNRRQYKLSVLVPWTLTINDQDLRNEEVPLTVPQAELYRITSKEKMLLFADPYSIELVPPDESMNVVFFDDPRKFLVEPSSGVTVEQVT